MQLCGIICEFNPFHNGHKYVIEQAKALTNSKIVCLMSGDFVQRGDPAIQEKYTRAKNAILSGADIVLELPTIYACSNAENFAFGSIKTLKALGVQKLAFGIEHTNLETLKKIADIKLENSIAFQNSFKNEIENGINYNTALKRAIAKELGTDDILKILEKPNNILAIEYLTAIKKLDAKIEAVAINRVDGGYNCETPTGKFLSASGIREKLLKSEEVSCFIPENTSLADCFNETHSNIFDILAISCLREIVPQKLSLCYDYTEGIEYRIKKMADQATSLSQLTNLVATPRYRVARLKKLFIYPLLEITKQKVLLAKKSKAFAKVLAIKKTSKDILCFADKRKIELIITNKDYEKLPASCKKIIEIDLKASNLYNTIIGKPNNNDKKTGVLFL